MKDLYKEIIKHSWKKSKKTQKNGKTSCVYELEDLKLLKCSYYPNGSTDMMHSLQKPNGIFCRNRKKNPKIHMEPQRTRNIRPHWESKNLKAWHFRISKHITKLP